MEFSSHRLWVHFKHIIPEENYDYYDYDWLLGDSLADMTQKVTNTNGYSDN